MATKYNYLLLNDFIRAFAGVNVLKTSSPLKNSSIYLIQQHFMAVVNDLEAGRSITLSAYQLIGCCVLHMNPGSKRKFQPVIDAKFSLMSLRNYFSLVEGYRGSPSISQTIIKNLLNQKISVTEAVTEVHKARYRMYKNKSEDLNNEA